jgi:hypothetical protein
MVPELAAAIAQSDQAEPSVRAAALLRIARVLTKFNQGDAERRLDQGLALLAGLPDEERTAIMPQAACLAACVAPARAFALHAASSDPLESGKFVLDMARHGHVTAVVEYLKQWPEGRSFPYSAVHGVMGYVKDQDARREILRSAHHAWHSGSDLEWHSFRGLLLLWRCHWRLLPADEARDEIRRIVGVIRERPDARLNASFGGSHGKVTSSSQHASLLFELLGSLKRLAPELADAVTGELPELSRAAERYPYGHDTDLDRQFEPPSAEALEQWKREWTGFMLGARFFRIDEEKAADFRDSFAYAFRALARDTDERHPNVYPRECWPSAEDFRTILFAAGRYECASASLLERIPDPPLRLFAQIEFAAGAAGLDQIGGITRENLARLNSSRRS